ncbi:MAG: flavodoxin-dependent (E)-4-hydroxy-3-methylbut-2-enyl-diphosphate synthase [Anaerohalosphaeraceae bacterium]|nr:flavodoxin-dependent (E)-4-hydroxy-3-methylbut-2-enyl-diphosphate synthase [Anaerohalosphaeraceae bacterium]
MIKRRKTRTIIAGDVKIGSDWPVVVQTMTKVATTDVSACLRQIARLKKCGADLVRIAVPTRSDTAAFAKMVPKAGIGLIADIHFSPARAIEAIEAGAVKIRLNPGNIKSTADINRIIDCAKAHRIAIRVGINEASIRDLKNDEVPAVRRMKLMLEKMSSYVKKFEKRGFDNLVLSVKSADVLRTVEANFAVAQRFDYPLHLGLTHAGLAEDAIIPSSVAMGSLFAAGIGDTIRISIAGDPAKEVEIAGKILVSMGLAKRRIPELIVCPTCGRCQVDVVKLARKVRTVLNKIDSPIRLAVMGCIVNGPGEAADADIALCAAKGKAFIYRQGRKVATVTESQILPAIQKELEKINTP